MAAALAFDLCRLFVAPIQRTPRGIDRMDMGFAGHFLKEWPGDCFGTIPTPWGARCVPRERSLRILEFALEHWGEARNPDHEALFLGLRDALTNGHAYRHPTYGKNLGTWSLAPAVSRILMQSDCLLTGSAAVALPPGTLFLNMGQIGLALPWQLSWLTRRPDIKPVFMLHDTIPLEYGEFVQPSSPRLHRNMIANTARHAAGVVVTTEAAKKAICSELSRWGRSGLPVLAEPLPVPPIFAQGSEPDPVLERVPYFVIAGTIEPRKNHLLLLNVWRELVAQDAKSAPKLVIAGSRWDRNDGVTSILDRSALLREHVIEAGGLSSPALRRLLSNACALLMPSFAEGFGLPIVEALATGTPVIASGIEAHREAGGQYATYLSPIDGMGWLTAIRQHMQNREERRRDAARCPVRSWPHYLQRLEPFLRSISAEKTAPRIAYAVPSRREQEAEPQPNLPVANS